MPRLASLIRSPVLEWRDVKTDETPVVESMGCWAIWPEQQFYDPTPREGWFPRNAGLGRSPLFCSAPILCSSSSLRRADISYTKGPSWLKAYPGYEHDKTSRFWDLARLSFPDARRERLNSAETTDQTPSPILNAVEDPDQQMLCMDYLFYVCGSKVRSHRQAYSIHTLTPSVL